MVFAGRKFLPQESRLARSHCTCSPTYTVPADWDSARSAAWLARVRWNLASPHLSRAGGFPRRCFRPGALPPRVCALRLPCSRAGKEPSAPARVRRTRLQQAGWFRGLCAPWKDAVQDLPAQETLPSTARKAHETILLVEDESAVRELAQMVLSQRGYRVIEAHTPEEAERLAGNNGAEIHLLLTDVVMPGSSGRELAKRLTGRYPNLRVLYMSGYTYNVIAQDGTLEEGISFLQKPFTPQVLSEKVREVLDRSVSAK